ncbi:hypothetical protein Tco_1112662 [Tanacetum coccineum]|uniref:Uncharacterized protein n=1 Tax=Tanacetum coccineum TaxID=301880 RepID=A0ABQ5ITM9_9ASTR
MPLLRTIVEDFRDTFQMVTYETVLENIIWYVVDDEGKISKLAQMDDHVESCLQQMKVRSIMIKGLLGF